MYIFLALLLLFSFSTSSFSDEEADPPVISYPGQVNIGLLSDMRRGGGTDRGLVRRAVATVWAVSQENYAHPQQINLGVYIFDTRGKRDLAERQAYRLLGQVVSEKKGAPPIFAVVSDGTASDAASAPGGLFDAFSVPVVVATSPHPSTQSSISTAADITTLATASVGVLQRLRLLEVVVLAEDERGELFSEFSHQASHVSGMKVEGAGVSEGDEVENSFAALRHIFQAGKSSLQAAVFLVSTEEASSLLAEAESEDQASELPWLFVTPTEVRLPPGKRRRKILLLSPESSDTPEFNAYFEKLLQEEETARYHPLLQEYLANNTADGTEKACDVSSIVRAVRLVSSALRRAQGLLCGRAPTECLRQRALKELRAHVKDALQGPSVVRYVLREAKENGDVAEVGSYSAEGGLQLYEENNFFDRFAPSSTPLVPSSQLSRWKIFDDSYPGLVHQSSSTSLKDPETTSKSVVPDDFLLLDESRLQSLTEGNSSSALPSSNLLSASITSHNEEHETRSKVEPPQSTVQRQPVSSWLGHRPWALGVLATSTLLSLAALYAFVFLLVSGCEDGGGARGVFLPALHMASLLLLCLSAGLHGWKPSPLICALRGVLTDCALVFCYAIMLLRGMYLRSQARLGLGGRVSRCNQLLTLGLALGVQLALTTWTLDCSEPHALYSRLYAGLLLVIAAGLGAAATRRVVVPFGQRESRSLLLSALSSVLLLSAWGVSQWLLPEEKANIATAALLLSTALCTLIGLQWAKGGNNSRKHRPLSYADSLSTVFTLFSKEDAGSRTSTTGRGRTKTLEKTTPSYGENLLYSEYKSAYP